MQTNSPEIYIQSIISVFIGLLLIAFIIVIFQLYQKRKQGQIQELKNMKSVFEKELLQTKLEIQEEVLKNISMEIHDNIGQVLLHANINITIMQHHKLPSAIVELITETKELLTRSIEDISQLSRSLHSDRITEMGVFEAITYELKLLAQKGLYEVVINNMAIGRENLLTRECQLILFRMYQEIVKNIIKHAHATIIEFKVEEKDSGIEMSIRDNGIGFDVLEKTQMNNGVSNGVGMRSLHSRVEYFNGNISVHSLLQEGTRISIFIPLKQC